MGEYSIRNEELSRTARDERRERIGRMWRRYVALSGPPPRTTSQTPHQATAQAANPAPTAHRHRPSPSRRDS